MTYVNILLEEREIKALSDTQQADYNDTVIDGKLRKIRPACNCIITGRGNVEILDKFTERANSSGCRDFDDLREITPGLFREVWRGFFRDIARKEFPKAPKVVIEHVIDQLEKEPNGGTCELFIAGHSNKFDKMCMLLMTSYGDFKEKILKAPFCFAPEGPAVDKFTGQLGRMPQTSEDLKTLLGFQFKWAVTGEWKSSVGSSAWTKKVEENGVSIPEGPVELCTLGLEGVCDYQEIGTFQNCLDLADKFQPVQAKSVKVGRNLPCPCGSGKKFKKCCG
ncbi:SEC-C metal-binding domain-containing protein [Desulfonatronovibrio magnus]|uniref:SEC-C metal-binding domain-containing protein n=1 Tax=Desulfonatronovibrio magnus TaxID=698827 RepID=UPI0005EB0329|nr:SEC-C metal-binding domain-containing protein [Desulfonatronovibrio magnus]